MLRRCLWCGALAALLFLPGCNVVLTAFLVPAQIWQGRLFELTVSGTTSGTDGNVACVVQLPAGFLLVGASNSARLAMTRDNLAVLGLYTAEPGHQLISFNGGSSGLAVRIE